ncbi:hypothetical protein [Fibrella aquatilis]|uniref:Uncharacterized protein n=1 Tax=Fibrella aquatilis TaxID=2817059 RepID=A0A939GC69_9BACT|nr:hypothetical protein [Fibrella aquatilis]MBO0934865.1 hypothetical protein [Fibrella aquatilis]
MPVLPLVDTGPNTLPIVFANMSLSGRSSSNAITVTSSINIQSARYVVKETGYCVSNTDSLPRLTNPNTRRIVVDKTPRQGIYNSPLPATLDSLSPGQIYYIDPYAVLDDGRILYGRHNHTKMQSTTVATAVSFRLPVRPPLLPVSFVERPPVPTPLTPSNSSPLPAYQQFIPLQDRLYAFYPTGYLQVYDPTTNNWKALSPLGTNVFATSYLVFAAGDKLFVHSSPDYWYGSNRPNPVMWEYDPAQDKWTDLGNDLGINLFNSRYLLAANGIAYFRNAYPYGMLAFDAKQKKTVAANKPTLLRINNYNGFNPLAGNTFIASVYDSNNDAQYISYDVNTDNVGMLTNLQSAAEKQGLIGSPYLVVRDSDLLTGWNVSTTMLLNSGSINATSWLRRDELIRFSTATQLVVGYYDIANMPGNANLSRRIISTGKRVFIFSTDGLSSLFTEVALP